MRNLVLAAAMAAVIVPAAPALAQPHKAEKEYRKDVRKAEKEYRKDIRKADNPREARQARREYNRNIREANRDWRQYRNYDRNRHDRGQGSYYANRYYRRGHNYQPRRLRYQDSLYRGETRP